MSAVIRWLRWRLKRPHPGDFTTFEIDINASPLRGPQKTSFDDVAFRKAMQDWRMRKP